MSTQWLEAKVLDNRHWTDTLFSLRVAGPPLAFEAGQFVRLAMDIDGERIARPFSFVNPPADAVHEFYGIVVPGGRSRRLSRACSRAIRCTWRPTPPASWCCPKCR